MYELAVNLAHVALKWLINCTEKNAIVLIELIKTVYPIL